MKEITAVVRMNMMNRTKKALTELGLDAFYAYEVQGRGKGFVNKKVLAGMEEGYEEAAAVLGEKGKLYPKRMLVAVVPDSEVDDIVQTIIAANQTGKPGDGKIFVSPVDDAVRVRSGECGEKSIA
ncbi:P-II family nitrogen regulator [Halodesulfovibrio aestuarii]|uniref:Nitrogen regulatory protein P-II family n=1 Tax=Halodesulfovibrio aestuarii TaxID=126333 RepID=A0A8G2C7F2_9BACT|nr:P-II family nitrogen regulator [Halodesulfovibrio aestuarii]SHI62810.1 nitrogen regulatory protein P-II family [Halodesulfovibrio aestuarii]